MEYIKIAVGRSPQGPINKSPTSKNAILTIEEQHYCSSPPRTPTKTLTDGITEYIEGFHMIMTEYNGVRVSSGAIKEQQDIIASMISKYVQKLLREGVTHVYTTSLSIEQLADFKDMVELEVERVCQKHFRVQRTGTGNSLY